MKKTVLIIFSLISVMFLVVRFSYKPLLGLLGLEQKSGLRVDANKTAEVILDNKSLGNTPFQKEDLVPGEHSVKLQSDSGSWSGFITLTAGTLSVINRELSEVTASSSGEEITLDKGSGVRVVSNPTGANLEIDSKLVGQTPISLASVGSGEHLFTLSHQNFLSRSVRAVLASGFNLSLSVDLASSEINLGDSLPTVTSNVLIVKDNPLGFLRVRDSASANGNEIEQVAPGSTMILLEELPSWDRVRLPDAKEGYVFSSYVERKQ